MEEGTHDLSPLWARQAKQWSQLGPPLRPSAEDMVPCQAAIDEWHSTHAGAPRALILGVTPDLATLRWRPGSAVVGSDLSFPMIRVVWPGPDAGAGVRRLAVQADWAFLPLPDAVCDLVLGDGSFSAAHHALQPVLRQSVRRVLKAGSTFVLRAYVRPDDEEGPDDVWRDLVERRIRNFHTFKLRLLMAVRRPNGDGRVVDAWRFFDERCPSVEDLARRVGWPVEEIRTIDAYRGQEIAYWFPTFAELRAELADGFDEVACVWPAYELGERCPTFTLRRRD